MLAIETVNLTKRYKNKAVVKGINLKINQGELFALLGTNGAGKTTTIKMLSTLILASDGEIKINDQLEWECPQCGNTDHAKMNVTRRTCGYLGENFWNVGKTKEINSRVLHI